MIGSYQSVDTWRSPHVLTHGRLLNVNHTCKLLRNCRQSIRMVVILADSSMALWKASGVWLRARDLVQYRVTVHCLGMPACTQGA